jgi:hypothetical protein
VDGVRGAAQRCGDRSIGGAPIAHEAAQKRRDRSIGRVRIACEGVEVTLQIRFPRPNVTERRGTKKRPLWLKYRGISR